MSSQSRIVITGMGVCSAIGPDVPTTAARLEAGASGLQEDVSLISGMRLWAGLMRDAAPADLPSDGLDRTALLALMAARESHRDARLDGASLPSIRVGLALGTSHGGRTQLDRFVEEGSDPARPGTAERLLVRAAHHEQAELVAHHLGLHGPVLTLSSACSSSATAIAHACALLRSEKADVMIAGGADAFSRLTAAGFQALKALAGGPCSPFSSRIGLSLGEGAGFVVLEELEHARRRGARILAELFGYGLSWDAYHITEPEPTGAGVLRALEMAARDAGIQPNEVDYLHAHGTGTRANDGAESRAISRFFQQERPPLVSATKSLTGHTLGASSVLGLIFTILGMHRGLVPPTAHFEAPRTGCDLDYVPNEPRPHRIRTFAVDSSGFGGTNAVLIGGQQEQAPRRKLPQRTDEVVLTGLGVVSPIGCDTESFLDGLRNGRGGISELRGAPEEPHLARRAGWIQDFDVRRRLPTVDARRMDRLMQYATAAVHSALENAGLHTGALASERLGLVVGTTRGAVSSFEKYLASVHGAQWQKASPIHFPNLVMSSIGGQVSRALGIKGVASTLVNGTTGGLHALVHGMELLRQDDSQDALVVVAADELNPLFHSLHAHLGMLSTESRGGESLRPYDPHANGMVLGEGAVAFVLERRSSALSRHARVRASLQGYGLSSDGLGPHGLEPEGRMLEHAMRAALADAGLGVHDLDLLYGHGRGLPRYDSRELLAFQRLLDGHSAPLCCVMGHTGVAESSCGLFSVAAALLGMEHGEAWPLLSSAPPAPFLSSTRHGSYRHSLIAGSTDSGANAALLLSRHDEAR